MIESIYSSKSIIAEINQSPFCPFVKTFSREHFAKGYGIPAIRHKLSLIVKFIRWLAYNSISPQKLKEHHVQKFKMGLPEIKKTPNSHGDWKGFVEFLLIIEKEYGHHLIKRTLSRFQKTPVIAKQMELFSEYMSHERGLTKTSIERFKTTIGQFLTFIFPKDDFDPTHITADVILEFIRERGKYFNDRTLRCDASAIKCYLRFIYGKGLTQADLSHGVPSFSVWRNQNVIHTISEEEMRMMLKSCDLHSAAGVRDFAILLLLMRYGLRPIEIISLKFDDVFWDEKKIKIHGKGRKVSYLPLEGDIEVALKRYIREARPQCPSSIIFIRNKAPIGPFEKSGAISSVVRHSLDRCGLKPEISGARLLRYSVASSILNKGGTLMEVSELLRHSSMNTSVRYIRLDMDRLKMVPLQWPTEWKEVV